MKPSVSGSLARLSKGPASVQIRPASSGDRRAIERLAEIATRDLLEPFLTKEQLAETSAFTPLDPWLLEDGTYFIAEIDGRIVASGGWSHRAPMIHDPNAAVQMPENPTGGTARIRAMYTDPTHARMGLGRTVLSVCEVSARLAGHQHFELIATPVGELMYLACGYERTELLKLDTPGGVAIQVARMQKIVRTNARLQEKRRIRQA